MAKEVPPFFCAETAKKATDPMPEVRNCALSGLAQMRLQFAEGQLDRIEVGLSRSCHLAIGRPIEAIADLLEQALLAHTGQIIPRNTDVGKFARPHDAPLSGQGYRTVSQRCLGPTG